MYDLSFFRANLDDIAGRLAARGFTLNLDEVRDLDSRRRSVIATAEGLRAQRNASSAEISKLRREGVDTAAQQQQVREIGQQITALEEQERAIDDEFRTFVAGIPNTPHPSVPTGRDADANLEVRRWGQAREFSFTPPRHGTRRQNHRRALRRLLGRGPAWSAPSSISCSTCTPASTATPRCCRPSGQLRQPLRHRPAPQVRRATCSSSRAPTSGSSPPRKCPSPTSTATRPSTPPAARQPLRLHALLPQRGRLLRP
jgi:hypothetical protein